MGFFGNLIGQGLGGFAGGLFGDKGRSIGAGVGGALGGGLIPFAGGGRIFNPLGMMVLKKGGKLRPLGRMPQMRMGGKVRKGSAVAKRKMAMLRSMKK
jgi:hypothetical protein